MQPVRACTDSTLCAIRPEESVNDRTCISANLNNFYFFPSQAWFDLVTPFNFVCFFESQMLESYFWVYICAKSTLYSILPLNNMIYSLPSEPDV